MSLVLVTGGSGFVGSYSILRLLEDGHQVRTTVRDLKREADVRAMLKQGGVEPGDHLTFVSADLEKDAGWDEAVAGCEYVLHVASPLPINAPKDENEVIVPARDGTLRVLRAARDAGVRRVVLTSSFAAIGYGQASYDSTLTEEDWTDSNAKGLAAYVKSKVVAERAAWEFVRGDGGNLELAVINPVAIFGPVLGSDFASSIHLVKMMLEGQMPGAPRLYFGVVDVRDVADLHVRAMTDPAAAGERFLASAEDSTSFFGIAQMLRARMGAAAEKAPAVELPDEVVREAARINPMMEQILPELGKVKHLSNEKARRLLGWAPRSNEDTIVATAESLITLGMVG